MHMPGGPTMDHEHTIGSQPSMKSPHSPIYVIERWLIVSRVYLIEYLGNGLIALLPLPLKPSKEVYCISILNPTRTGRMTAA